MKMRLLTAMAIAVAVSGCARDAATSCHETPAVDRWPEDYGRARGTKDFWLVDNGGAHSAGEKRKVGWRVVGAAETLTVKGERTDGRDKMELTVSGRVWPNGRDHYPTYSDFVSYLTLPSEGCWRLTLGAGAKSEQIVLNVR